MDADDKAELELILSLAVSEEKTNAACREIAWRVEAILIKLEQQASRSK